MKKEHNMKRNKKINLQGMPRIYSQIALKDPEAFAAMVARRNSVKS